jgi:hypothetical protein
MLFAGRCWKLTFYGVVDYKITNCDLMKYVWYFIYFLSRSIKTQFQKLESIDKLLRKLLSLLLTRLLFFFLPKNQTFVLVSAALNKKIETTFLDFIFSKIKESEVVIKFFRCASKNISILVSCDFFVKKTKNHVYHVSWANIEKFSKFFM